MDTTKSKILNALLILTSLAGYLEWSGDSRMFLFQAEGEVLSKLFTDPIAVLHPFTILPMAGQLLLLVTLFQKSPGKALTYSGIAALGILLVFMLAIGLMSMNLRIAGSTLPFIAVAMLTIRHYRSGNRNQPGTGSPAL